MDAIVSVDPNTIPVRGMVYAVFYPYDGFVQKCDTYEDAVRQVDNDRANGVPEDADAVVVQITVLEVYNPGRRVK